MEKIFEMLKKMMHGLMAVCLATMAILVFGNVVLRYAFDSGITWSEEMSRFCFIWLTFLGAIGALMDNDHLGIDMFIKKLPLNAKRAVFIISNLLILFVLWLVLDGSWKLTLLNLNTSAPATGMPLFYIYGIGIVLSIGMGIIVLCNIYRVLFQKEMIDKLTKMKESEEEIMESVHEEIIKSHQQQATAGGKG
jgi:TRAP-type C4-dicarboxylate transport system permease small subunit